MHNRLLTDILANPLVDIGLVILVLVTIQVILRHVMGKIINSTLKRNTERLSEEDMRRGATLARMLHTVVAVVLWITGIIAILTILNVNLTALVTGAGAIGVVFGVVFQSIIKDYMSGFAIILENQYRINDSLQLTTGSGTFVGTVEDINIRTTKLRSLDGSFHIVPNGSIQAVTNFTFKFSKVVVDVILSYDTDIGLVESIMNKVGQEMAETDHWRKYIVEPIQFYRVDSFNESSITVKAVGKVDSAGMQWTAAGEYRKRLHKQFAGHNLPLPSSGIMIRDAAGTSRVRAKKSKK